MSETLLQAARDEEHRLVDELRPNPTFRKLEIVRNLIAAYETGERAGGITAFANVTIPGPRASGRASTREGTKAFSHISEAQAFLRNKGARAQTREIMEALQARGVVFEGEKPMAALASTLSHSALFDNVRGEGYGLVEWANSGDPPDFPTPIDDGVNLLASEMQHAHSEQPDPQPPNKLQSIIR